MSEGGVDDVQQFIEISRELGQLGAKMDVVQTSILNLGAEMSANYVPRKEYEKEVESQSKRIDKLEAAPHRWVSTGIGLLAIVVSVLGIWLK